MTQIEKLRFILSLFYKQEQKSGQVIWLVNYKDQPEWVMNIIHEVHGEKGPDDSTYEFIHEALVAIDEDYQEPDVDFEDCLMRIDPNIYTNQLTGWLHRRPDHIYYLEQALEQYREMGSVNFSAFDLLQCAQMVHKLEVGQALIVASRNDPPDKDPAPNSPKDPDKPSVTIPGKDDFVMDAPIDVHQSREEEGEDGWDIRYSIHIFKLAIKSDKEWSEWYLETANGMLLKDGENSYWGKECLRNAQASINSIVAGKKQITAFRDLLRRVLNKGHQPQHCEGCARVILDDDNQEECESCAASREEYEREING